MLCCVQRKLAEKGCKLKRDLQCWCVLVLGQMSSEGLSKTQVSPVCAVINSAV